MENQKPNSTPNERRPRSGGPQTPEGRARSSQNAKRHGVLSDNIVVLRSESEDAYAELVLNYYQEFQPANFRERELLDEMIWAKWRQKRAIRVETATVDERMDDEAPRWIRECPTVDDDTRTASAMKSLVDGSNELQHLSRYETRFHRMYHRSLRQLLELQEKRIASGRVIDSKAESPKDQPPSQAPEANLPNEQPTAAPLDTRSKSPNDPARPAIQIMRIATNYHPRSIKSSSRLITADSDCCTDGYSPAKLTLAG